MENEWSVYIGGKHQGTGALQDASRTASAAQFASASWSAAASAARRRFGTEPRTYAPTVGVTPAEVTQLAADAPFFNYVCDTHHLHTQTTRDWTAFKHQAAHGDALGNIPVTPDPGTPPPVVPPDIFGRASTLAVRIKNSPNYTEAIGQDLGIIGAEVIVDLNSLKPVLTLSLTAGHPHIGWSKQGMDSLELLADRGDGKGFVPVTFTTNTDYADNSPLPAAGVSAVWKYKAVYRLNDAQAGQWSDVATIGVMGLCPRTSSYSSRPARVAPDVFLNGKPPGACAPYNRRWRFRPVIAAARVERPVAALWRALPCRHRRLRRRTESQRPCCHEACFPDPPPWKCQCWPR